MDQREEKYAKLKVQLEEGFEWPTVYMFKFIIPANNEKLAKVQNLFNSKESTVEVRESSKGNYLSITAKEMMMSPDGIIERYLEAEAIGGVIAL